MSHHRVSGSSARWHRRMGIFTHLTRTEKFQFIRGITDVAEVEALIAKPENAGRVKRQAERQLKHLTGGFPKVEKVFEVEASGGEMIVEASTPEDAAFRALVERFRQEGKANPEKSARASIAAKAGNAKRKAPAEVTA